MKKLMLAGLVSILLIGGCGDDGFNTVVMTASDVDCDRLAKEWSGRSISNSFGAEFKIMKIYDPQEESRTKDKLSCLAEVMLDKSDSDKIRMIYEKDRDGDWFNSIETITD